MSRVCHIISGDLWAGAEVMACNLLKSLSQHKDLSVFAIVLNDGRLARELESAGIATYILDEQKIPFLSLLFKARALIKKHDIQIVHTHRYKENMLGFFLSILLRNVRLIATQHGMPELCDRHILKDAFVNHLNFIIMRLFFKKTIAVSHDIETILSTKYHFRRSTVGVIHNGVSLPQQPVHRQTHGVFSIGTAGRLVPVKGYTLFIDIAKELEQFPDIRLILAGDGPDRDALQQYAESIGVSRNLTFSGHIDDTDIFYRQLDLFINTSLHEGIPMTVLEAMGYGIPIIAPQVGGIPEIITDGVEGFLLKQRSATQFAEKCSVLYKDKTVYTTMAVAVRKKIKEQFSLTATMNHYIREYSKIVEINIIK